MKKILIIHQNFPAQFKHLAPALVSRGYEVKALTMSQVGRSYAAEVEIIGYSASRSSSNDIHRWVSDFETKIIRGEACYLASSKLSKEGYEPDIIIAHPGWGESLFIKEVWPNAKLGIYSEFYYHYDGYDIGFDDEFEKKESSESCRIKVKNINNDINFSIADGAICPTHFQASTFPVAFREKITVVHDGINTKEIKPNNNASIKLTPGRVLTKKDEIVTFVNRNLEPYRGFHIFMRALPQMLKSRPNAHFIIIGEEGVSYGSKPESSVYGSKSWKQIYIEEVKNEISEDDWSRVHFVGKVPYTMFVRLMQISSAHVYLTYPFVLSWSLLEAMSAGCPIVASDTAPVKEVIKHKETGLLVDFFNYQKLAATVCELLENSSLRTHLGVNARKFIVENYDLEEVCLPNQMEWIDNL